MLGKTFLRGLLSHHIDSPTILFFINFKVPQLSTRTPISFYIPHFKSNYMKNMKKLLGGIAVVFIAYFTIDIN